MAKSKVLLLGSPFKKEAKRNWEKPVRTAGTHGTVQDLVFIKCYFKYATVQKVQLAKVELIYFNHLFNVLIAYFFPH